MKTFSLLMAYLISTIIHLKKKIIML